MYIKDIILKDIIEITKDYIDYFNRFEKSEWDESKVERKFQQLVERFDYVGLGIYVDDKIIGFCVGALSQFDDGLIALLNEIYIIKEKQSKGYGSKLLNSFEEKMFSLGAFRIQLESANDGIHNKFYNEMHDYIDDKNNILIFSFIGYKNQAIQVNDQTKINVQLKLSSESLDEVVVIGYGKTTVKELTGATVQVKGESIERLNIPRMDQALQGQVSGVTINTNSGSPGGSSSIRIRGLSTFGDNDPLILVDGVVYDSEGLNSLNPGDIESINVLKDATAGIYGVRAANGVIIIETKKGRIGAKPKFEVGSYVGVQQTTNSLDLLNAAEYALIKNEMFIRGTGSPIFNNTDLKVGTNWQDSIFQSAPIESFNFGVTGGSKKSSYSIGGNYFSQDGIVGGDKSSFDRYNARVNLVNSLTDKLTLSRSNMNA